MEDQKVVVYVSGGNIQAIYSNNPNITVKVIDEDNMIAEGKTRNECNKEVTKEVKNLTMIY